MKKTLIFTLAAMTAPFAFAQTVIHWDHDGSGPYATGNINGSNFSTSGTDTQMDYSASTPAFEQGVTGTYTGPTVYAGVSITTDATIDSGDFFRALYRPSDGLRFQYSDNDNTNTPTNVDLSFVSMWLKADFQNGFDSAIVDFTAGGVLSVDVSDFSVQEIRFVVRNGNSYYVSEIFADQPGLEVDSTFTLSDVNATNWASWDPTGARFDSGSASFGSLTFAEVTGVGVYGMLNHPDAPIVNIRDFQATAIPEPSTYAALAGLLALGFVAWRRRHR